MYTLKDLRRDDAKRNPQDFLIESLIGKVRTYRIFFGISQRELSKKSGVTQNIISRMENGLTTPNIQTIFKLLDALNLDIEITVKPRLDEKENFKDIDKKKLKTMRNEMKKISDLSKEELEEVLCK